MEAYNKAQEQLKAESKTWLVTGVAGFIGSNLLEFLLSNNQKVRGLDNFATGHQANLDDVKKIVGDELWQNFSFVHGDIQNAETCKEAIKGVDYVLHQAALGSVPRSIEDPLTTNSVNISGSLNVLRTACDAKVKRFVYASSSSVYGDSEALPKVESVIGNPLSPYAVSKRVNELYADVFAKLYEIEIIGLRYFNVFGPRQDPAGPYAAVIPLWVQSLLEQRECFINGDGKTSRDFCYIANVIQANVLAALCQQPAALNNVYNVALGDRINLNELYNFLHEIIKAEHCPELNLKARYRDFRPGDPRHSLADTSKIEEFLGYQPLVPVKEGLQKTVRWYHNRQNS